MKFRSLAFTLAISLCTIHAHAQEAYLSIPDEVEETIGRTFMACGGEENFDHKGYTEELDNQLKNLNDNSYKPTSLSVDENNTLTAILNLPKRLRSDDQSAQEITTAHKKIMLREAMDQYAKAKVDILGMRLDKMYKKSAPEGVKDEDLAHAMAAVKNMAKNFPIGLVLLKNKSLEQAVSVVNKMSISAYKSGDAKRAWQLAQGAKQLNEEVHQSMIDALVSFYSSMTTVCEAIDKDMAAFSAARVAPAIPAARPTDRDDKRALVSDPQAAVVPAAPARDGDAVEASESK